MWVFLADDLVNAFAVELRSARTRTGLQVVCKTACRSVVVLAERACDSRTAMYAGVHVLRRTVSNSIVEHSMRLAYLSQIVCILKRSVAVSTDMSPVPELGHVLIRRGLGAEHVVTSLTVKSRGPVVQSVHMLIAGMLSRKCAWASLAVECRCPVVQSIHVLIAGTLSCKRACASFAFGPMTPVAHVLVAVILVVELIVACLAFEHCESSSGRPEVLSDQR